MRPRQFQQEGEMRRGIVGGGRNAHQALQRQLQRAGVRHQRIQVGRKHAGLLRLLAGIDLNEQARRMARAIPLRRQRIGQPDAVQALDAVEQRRRFLDLVGLQGPDQMQFQIGIVGLELGKLGLRFLHPVFTEQALSGGQRGADALFRYRLGHRDQMGGGRRVDRGLSRRCDAGQNIREIIC